MIIIKSLKYFKKDLRISDVEQGKSLRKEDHINERSSEQANERTNERTNPRTNKQTNERQRRQQQQQQQQQQLYYQKTCIQCFKKRKYN